MGSNNQMLSGNKSEETAQTETTPITTQPEITFTDKYVPSLMPFGIAKNQSTTPQDVAYGFITDYYTDIQKTASNCRKYQSTYTSATWRYTDSPDHAMAETAEDVPKAIKEIGFEKGLIDVFTVTAIRGEKGTVTIHLIGSLTNKDETIRARRFTHVIHLVPNISSYSIFMESFVLDKNPVSMDEIVFRVGASKITKKSDEKHPTIYTKVSQEGNSIYKKDEKKNPSVDSKKEGAFPRYNYNNDASEAERNRGVFVRNTMGKEKAIVDYINSKTKVTKYGSVQPNFLIVDIQEQSMLASLINESHMIDGKEIRFEAKKTKPHGSYRKYNDSPRNGFDRGNRSNYNQKSTNDETLPKKYGRDQK